MSSRNDVYELLRYVIHWKSAVGLEKQRDILESRGVSGLFDDAQEVLGMYDMVLLEINRAELDLKNIENQFVSSLVSIKKHAGLSREETERQNPQCEVVKWAHHLEAHRNVGVVDGVIAAYREDKNTDAVLASEKGGNAGYAPVRSPGVDFDDGHGDVVSKDVAIEILRYFSAFLKGQEQSDVARELDAQVENKLSCRWAKFKNLFFVEHGGSRTEFERHWAKRTCLISQAHSPMSNVYGCCVTYLALRHLQHNLVKRLDATMEEFARKSTETERDFWEILSPRAADIKEVISVFQTNEENWLRVSEILDTFDQPTLDACCSVLTLHASMRSVKQWMIQSLLPPLRTEICRWSKLREKLKIVRDDTQQPADRRETLRSYIASVSSSLDSPHAPVDLVVFEDLNQADSHFAAKFRTQKLLLDRPDDVNSRQFTAFLDRFDEHLRILLPEGIFRPPLPHAK